MRVGLFFQAGNFIGPEYYAFLRESGHDISPIQWGVASQQSRAREIERTGGLWSPDPIKEIAGDVSEWGDSAIRRLSEFDVCVNGGIGVKLKTEYLAAPKWGWLNVHPGDLPDFRGSSCPEWSVLLGKPVVCTAHKMDEGIDTGPLIRGDQYCYGLDWSYHQFRAHLYLHCATVLLRALLNIRDGKCLVPQNDGGTTWPQMPPEILDIVKLRFFPHHPRVI